MTQKILIVEDEFIVANDLRIMLERAGYNVCGIAASASKALELVASTQPHWVLLDIFLQGEETGVDLAKTLKDQDIPFIYLSANTNRPILEAAKATMPYGFLVKPFREKDLLVMLDIALYRHAQELKYSLSKNLSIPQQLAKLMEEKGSGTQLITNAAALLHTLVPFDLLWITRSKPLSAGTAIYIQHSAEACNYLSTEQMLKTLSFSQRDFKIPGAYAIPEHNNGVYSGFNFNKLRMENRWVKTLSDHFQLSSALFITTELREETYQFGFLSSDSTIHILAQIGDLRKYEESLRLFLKKIFHSEEASKLVEAITKPLPAVTATPDPFRGIIGESPLLKTALSHVRLVAPDDASVLVLGESGTGKERIARAIHELSSRRAKAMIIVNCATLPLSLIESELFGHEKGAFTSANERRIGKFEQADGSSIFLDEIGELPLEAQVKLLRVLQEKEIQRVGGCLTRKINVRVIAATNRNLEKEVAEGRFRLDLYYRLNVFPIELPSLRSRKEDIAALVDYFFSKFNIQHSRKITGISEQALASLRSYDWPGNIRELEHLIQRNMLTTTDAEIRDIELPIKMAEKPHDLLESPKIKTMEEMERDHIMSILKMCKGKVYGPGGAAEILNIPSTTLNSKIKKLGITYEFVN